MRLGKTKGILSYRRAFLLVFSLFIFFLSDVGLTTNGCDGCKRRYRLIKFINIHAPDLFERIERFNKCMENALPPGYQTFDENDPLFKEALKKCAHLEVKGIEFMNPKSIDVRIGEVLHEDCVRRALDDWDYVFEGSFEVFENRGNTGDQNQGVASRMILNLFYNGDSKELVETFQTDSPTYTATSHWGRMFENHDAALKRYLPFIERLRAFEKRPQSCLVDTEKEELGPEEEIEIRLEDFKDEKGNTSREFNRILVEARKGKILNGVQSALDENKKVFKVGTGTVTLKYKAPDNCDAGEDTLTIYNSCDIVGESQRPLSQTRIDKEIETKTLRIVCYEARITRSTYSRYVPSSYSNDTQEIEVTLRLELEPFQETSTLLRIKSYEVASFRGQITYEHGPARDRKKDVWILSSATPKEQTFLSDVIRLKRDPVSKKVTQAAIPIYVVDLIWSGSDQIVPPETLTIGPVTEKKDVRVPRNRENPMAMMKFLNSSINQDFEVTKGDGLNFFGGEAKIETTTPEGDLKKIDILRWEIRRK